MICSKGKSSSYPQSSRSTNFAHGISRSFTLFGHVVPRDIAQVSKSYCMRRAWYSRKDNLIPKAHLRTCCEDPPHPIRAESLSQQVCP
jgi:hypothetical protein